MLVLCSCAVKCWFSYYYEIRLQVQNQANVWTAIVTPFQRGELMQRHGTFWDTILFESARSDSGDVVVAYLVLGVTWLPILLVFLIDAQIFFSLLQTITGVWCGLRMRVGQGNKWHDLEQALAKRIIPRYKEHLDACEKAKEAGSDSLLGNSVSNHSQNSDPESLLLHPLKRTTITAGENLPGIASGARTQGEIQLRAALLCESVDPSMRFDIATHNHTSDNSGSVPDATDFRYNRDGVTSASYKHFVEAWNRFMQKLQSGDYINKREQSIYSFMILTDSRGLEYKWAAPILYLGSIGHLLDTVTESEDEFRNLYFGKTEKKTEKKTEEETEKKTEKKKKIRSDANSVSPTDAVLDTHDYDQDEWVEHATHLIETFCTDEFNDCREALCVSVDLCLFLIGAPLGCPDGPSIGRDIVPWVNDTLKGSFIVKDAKGKDSLGPVLRTLLTRPTVASAKAQRQGLVSCANAFARCIQDCCSPAPVPELEPEPEGPSISPGARDLGLWGNDGAELLDEAEKELNKAQSNPDKLNDKDLQKCLDLLGKAVENARDYCKLRKKAKEELKKAQSNPCKLNDKDLQNCRDNMEKAVKKARDALSNRPSDPARADAVDATNLAYLRILLHQMLLYIRLLCEGGQPGDLKKGTVNKLLSGIPFLSKFDDGSVDRQVFDKLAQDPNIPRAAEYLQHILKTRRGTAKPRSLEARRRILTFASSLYHLRVISIRTGILN
eukprot:COSAG01_NODE_379_length_17872_cov_8.030102_6_plen_725_part_00